MPKKFMAIFTGAPTSPNHAAWDKLDEAARNARAASGMQAWGGWMQKNAKQIDDPGGPLGKNKRVSAKGIADVRNECAGYTIVEAESHEAAAKLFENHPHFTIFPGDGVDIMEIMPIPKGP